MKKDKDNKAPYPEGEAEQEWPAPEPTEQPNEQEDTARALRESAKAAAMQMMEALKQREALGEALKETEQKAEMLQNQLLRLKAEFDNYRKRTAGELSTARDEGVMETLRLLLPTLDNLERALSIAREDGSASVVTGLDMVLGNLMDSFEKKGFRQMEALGERFDPNLHAAIMQEPCEDDSKKDSVAEVLQKGYLYKDRVLRYATVKVFV